jgi:hypothetical protein
VREFFIDAPTATLARQGQASLHAIGEPPQDVRRVLPSVEIDESDEERAGENLKLNHGFHGSQGARRRTRRRHAYVPGSPRISDNIKGPRPPIAGRARG